jgi:hypothetical protein
MYGVKSSDSEDNNPEASDGCIEKNTIEVDPLEKRRRGNAKQGGARCTLLPPFVNTQIPFSSPVHAHTHHSGA